MRKNSKRFITIKRSCAGYLFILPSLIGIGFFLAFPLIDVLRRSFVSNTTWEFSGLENYKRVLTNSAFKLAITNTAWFTLICIPMLMVISLVIATAMHNLKNDEEGLKNIFLFPMVIPVSSVVLVWNIVFDRQGLLNSALSIIGIGNVDWMNSDYAFVILIISYIWKNLGYDIILWLAGLSGIPDSIYEAAYVDGASKVKCFIYITLPNLKYTVFMVSVISLINSFKVFREAYLVSGEYPDTSIYMMQNLFNNWLSDMAIDKIAAGAVIFGVLIFTVIIVLYCIFARRDKT
ncbi:MAG: sugar ABC transporter permease [Ruminococcus sp.]|nr:sugar ABC transporter permease [Ruminococcus sp.]